MKSILVCLLALIIANLIGCVGNTSKKWPPFDEKRMHLVLVAGHFSDVRKLDENPCLWTSADFQPSDLHAHCYYGTPSMAKLSVYRVVHGRIRGKELDVAFHPALNEVQSPGGGKPLLVLLRSDGMHFQLSEYMQIARTVKAEWAMPIFEDAQLAILPCGARPLVRPIKFADPAPSRSSKEFAEKDFAEFMKNPRVRISDGRMFIHYGVLLDDLIEFLNSNFFPEPENYYCRDYEYSD